MRISLAIGDKSLLLTGNADDYFDTLSNLFAAWRQERDERDRSDAYHLTITKKGNTYQIAVPDSNLIEAEAGSLVSVIEQIITCAARESMQDYLQLHAATLDSKGDGFTIAGPHGAGKTTLALTALSCGCTALSDEITVIRKANLALGFPRPFRVRPGILELHPSVIPSCIPSLLSTDNITHLLFSIPSLGFYRPETRIRHIFFPVRRSGGTEVQPLTQRETLERLLPQGFNIYQRPDEFMHVLIELVRMTESHEIRYHDHWHAIQTIQQMIHGSS
ncbi:hypothetical protein LLG96_06105 [bacterium]|nr:hypothetical protein [bacterium]